LSEFEHEKPIIL